MSPNLPARRFCCVTGWVGLQSVMASVGEYFGGEILREKPALRGKRLQPR